jgi:hypothetical protein
MFEHMLQVVSGSSARVGWSALVDSMESALSDRTHLVVLGIAAGVIFVLYVNYRVARWLDRRGRSGS